MRDITNLKDEGGRMKDERLYFIFNASSLIPHPSSLIPHPSSLIL